MKTPTRTLVLGALALGFLGTSAFAQGPLPALPAFRCTSCGAEYQVKTKVMKDNTLQVKLEKVVVSGNPKGR